MSSLADIRFLRPSSALTVTVQYFRVNNLFSKISMLVDVSLDFTTLPLDKAA